MNELKEWFRAHAKEIREDYFSFLRFASISTDPHYEKEVLRCVEWLLNYIEKHTSMKGELIPTPNYPLLFAKAHSPKKGAPTLLAYGHYDVQPADEPDWETPPFEPVERNGKIYARGAVDDKGQIFYAIMVMRAYHEMKKELPVNVKFCIEGEEESASQGLLKVLPNLKEQLRSDAFLVIDFGQFDATTPAITLSARGLVAFEIVLTGSNSDLHSGLHGGMAYNPNRALVELLAKVWDEDGRIQIPGFYKDVFELSQEEKRAFAFPFNEKNYGKEFGIGAIGGEKGYTLFEKNTLRPTFEINGISGGYTGGGFKTVIPAKSVAKISCRLVPHQNPAHVMASVEQFLRKQAPIGMHIEVRHFGAAEAFWGRADSPLAKAVVKASTEVMGKECKKTLGGGSIPVITEMAKTLHLDAVGMGYALPGDRIHSANECFDFKRFEFGFLTFAKVLELL